MQINASYGRVVGETLQYAPKPLVVNKHEIYTSDPSVYHDNGWFTIVTTKKPTQEGFFYVADWVEDADAMTVTQTWTEHEFVEEDDSPSNDERLSSLEDAICELADIIGELLEVLEA